MQFDFSIRCRHCDAETVEPVLANVTGSIPSYALGDYFFNSSGIGHVGSAEYRHVHDFGGVLHKVRVSSSGCSYRSRYLQSSTFAKNQKAGTIAVTEFATAGVAPAKKNGLVGKFLRMVDLSTMISDNCCNGIVALNGKLFAVGDTPIWLEFDPDDLSVIKKDAWMMQSLGLTSLSPHCVPLSNGNHITAAQSITASGSKYNIVEFPRSGENPRVVGKFTPRWRYSLTQQHSFGVSRNYFIIQELPVALRCVDLIKSLMTSVALIDVCKSFPEETLEFLVTDQKTWKQQRKFSLKNQYVHHIVNCYETDDGDLIIDFEGYKDAEMVFSLMVSNLKNPNSRVETMDTGFKSTLTRAILPLSSSDSSCKAMGHCVPLCDAHIQFPTVNPNYFARPYKFAYGTSPTEQDNSRATKVNVETGEAVHFMEPGLYMTEANYIPNPNEKAEDDGTVVIFCLSSKSSSYGCLLFLSAADMTETARVAFTAAGAVPWMNHGHFSPASS